MTQTFSVNIESVPIKSFQITPMIFIFEYSFRPTKINQNWVSLLNLQKLFINMIIKNWFDSAKPTKPFADWFENTASTKNYFPEKGKCENI